MFYCGSFSIQTISKNYSNNTTSIRATSVNFASEQKERKDYTWESTNLYNVAMKIAEQNGMGYSIDESAKEFAISSEQQNNATDLGFLNILTTQKGFLLTVKNNTIMIKPKDAVNLETAVVNTTATTHKTFKLGDLSELEITDANRNNYDAVRLTWHDDDDRQDKELKTGSGVSIPNIPIAKPKSDAEAIEYANARLKESQTGGITGSFSIAGQEIRAGWNIEIEGIGKFLVKSASHSFTTSDFTTSCEIKG
jgi:phage protein D